MLRFYKYLKNETVLAWENKTQEGLKNMPTVFK